MFERSSCGNQEDQGMRKYACGLFCGTCYEKT